MFTCYSPNETEETLRQEREQHKRPRQEDREGLVMEETRRKSVDVKMIKEREKGNGMRFGGAEGWGGGQGRQ